MSSEAIEDIISCDELREMHDVHRWHWVTFGDISFRKIWLLKSTLLIIAERTRTKAQSPSEMYSE
jgi:hypothetical protein